MTELTDLLQSSHMQSSESKHLEVLKDLADEDKQKILSELSEDEIKVFTRLKALSNLLKKRYRMDVLPVETILDSFLLLRVNKDRKRAGEIVSAFTSDRIARSENTMMRRMMGGGNSGGFVR